jgi:hypothetical protein
MAEVDEALRLHLQLQLKRAAYDAAEGDRPRHPDTSIYVVCRWVSGTLALRKRTFDLARIPLR